MLDPASLKMESIKINLPTFVDPVIKKVAPEEIQGIASPVANWALYHLIKDVLGISVHITLNCNPNGIVLSQIKNGIKDLQKDVNVLLEADYHAALNWISLVVDNLEEEQFPMAFDRFKEILSLTVRGYSQLKSWPKKAKCKEITIYALKMIATYKEATQTFVDVSDLSTKERRSLAKNVKTELDAFWSDWRNRKRSILKSLTTTMKEHKKIDDAMNCLRKSSLPLIWDLLGVYQNGTYSNDFRIFDYIPESEKYASDGIKLENRWPVLVWCCDVDEDPMLFFQVLEEGEENQININDGERDESVILFQTSADNQCKCNYPY